MTKNLPKSHSQEEQQDRTPPVTRNLQDAAILPCPQRPIPPDYTKPSIVKPRSRRLVKAGHGLALPVPCGTKVRITDLHGSQIVDFIAWRAYVKSTPPLRPHRSGLPPLPRFEVDPKLHFSAAHTRWRLGGATPAIGECLLDTAGQPILRVTGDTVKVHDMTFPCCYPELYEEVGLKGHRSCAQNMIEGLTDAGYAWVNDGKGGLRKWIDSHLQVPPPFNIFQNTPFYAIKGGLLSSKAGDYIEMEVLGSGVVCVVSSCPWDVDDFSPPTDVLVEVGV